LIRDVKSSKLAQETNRNTKQNSVNPSNIAHTRRTGSLLAVSRGVLYFDHRRPTFARAVLFRTITGCVQSWNKYSVSVCFCNSFYKTKAILIILIIWYDTWFPE